MKEIHGYAKILGDDINSDIIHPSRFYSLDTQRLAAGVLANEETQLAPETILIAGRNFGVGSSRESAVRGLIAAGIKAVVAVNLSRIFMRNALNAGLPVFEGGFSEKFTEGEKVTVSFSETQASLSNTSSQVDLSPLDAYWFDVLAHGGLLSYTGLA